MRRTLTPVVLGIVAVQAALPPCGAAEAAINAPEAARGVLQRLVPGKADRFLLETIPADNGRDVFEIESPNGKIVIRGSSGVALAEGKPFDANAFEATIRDWEVQWTRQTDSYPTTPSGDAVAVSRRLWDKYSIYFTATHPDSAPPGRAFR